MNKRTKKKLKNLFIPNKDNNYRPKFFETGTMVLFSAFVIGIFLFSINISDILKTLAKTSQLSAVLPSVLIEMTNEERVKSSLGTLTENELLNKAASLKAHDMASRGYFAHVNPDGKKPWNWLQDVGYKYQYAGENLAVNFEESKDVTVAWMNSPTHKANIIKSEYTEIGIAVATGTLNGNETVFVAQVFAKPAPIPTNATGNVLGAFDEIKDPLKDFFNYLLNNNHDLTNKILIGLLVFVITALLLKVFINIKIQHSTLIRNGLIVCGLIILLILINNFIQANKFNKLEYSSLEYGLDQNGENVIKTQ